jgi:plastocyanin
MFRQAYAILVVVLLVIGFGMPEQLQGNDFYGGVTYYYSAPSVVYYRSYAPVYYSYSRPTYYYYSYSSPCVDYSPPMSYEPSYSHQRSDTREYSSRQASPSAPTTIATVGAYDNRFEPQTINVQPGSTVRWVNYGQHAHTVTAGDDSWDSGDVQPGASYSVTFKRPGTYYYYCRHHTQDRMQGVVVVGATTGNETEGARTPGY